MATFPRGRRAEATIPAVESAFHRVPRMSVLRRRSLSTVAALALAAGVGAPVAYQMVAPSAVYAQDGGGGDGGSAGGDASSSGDAGSTLSDSSLSDSPEP